MRSRLQTQDFLKVNYFTKTAVCDPIAGNQAKKLGDIWAFKSRWSYCIGVSVFSSKKYDSGSGVKTWHLPLAEPLEENGGADLVGRII